MFCCAYKLMELECWRSPEIDIKLYRYSYISEYPKSRMRNKEKRENLR